MRRDRFVCGLKATFLNSPGGLAMSAISCVNKNCTADQQRSRINIHKEFDQGSFEEFPVS